MDVAPSSTRFAGFLLTVALTSSIAGCIAANPSTAACDDGPEPFLFRASWTGGYSREARPFHLALIDRSGILIEAEGEIVADAKGFPKAGSGSVRTRPGSLFNATVEDVKVLLERSAYYDSSWDYNLTYAYRAALTVADRDRFCGLLLEQFDKFEPSYESRLADGGSLLMVSSTAGGTKAVRNELSPPPSDLQEFLESFREVREEASRTAGRPVSAR